VTWPKVKKVKGGSAKMQTPQSDSIVNVLNSFYCVTVKSYIAAVRKVEMKCYTIKKNSFDWKERTQLDSNKLSK
jgi:hypothetical protein